METAWFLTGLAYSMMAAPAGLPDLREIATKTYRELILNQGDTFFGHLSKTKSLSGRLRGWMGSFADQVYPIIALTRFSQVLHEKDALDRALLAGKGICRVQGPLGQWWWHYDSRVGRVASMYPVFSVHQEAMGPMALFPLGEVAGQDFRQPIYKGLHWIGTQNELGREIRDFEHNLVWRCVRPVPESSMELDVLASYFHAYRDASQRSLEILYECRPYELGWLLYAFAGRA
jgi:hypothetical protein